MLESAGTWLPLGMVYVAGGLQKAGYEVRIYDAMTKFHTFKDIKRQIKRYNPDAVGTAAYTSSLNDAVQVLRIAKEVNPETVTVLGGIHPTFCWEGILQKDGRTSCYGGAGCHALRNDVSGKTTLNGVVSNYSNSSSNYDKYHNSAKNYTVQCIICHGPMHNITKPDESQRLIRNNDTESSHCTTCHASYAKHNATVNCTLCHSEDIHAIQVFAQNATYITLNRTNPNSARGNCTTCHQNSTFRECAEKPDQSRSIQRHNASDHKADEPQR